MVAYYNEHDSKVAAWLRDLIKANLIAPGDVDERSIEDVLPSELVGYTQCHFFAGLGVWSYALRNAGWPDDRPIWTGSCPCQPFSQAGKGKGFADERHLWPAWFHLIQQRRPDVVFGEQVESKDGRAWLDLVQTDLEAIGYAVGPVGLCAAGFGASHIRHRLFFVADTSRGEQWRIRENGAWNGRRELPAGRYGAIGELANTSEQRYDGRRTSEEVGWTGELERSRNAGELGDASGKGLQERISNGRIQSTAVGSSEGQAFIGGSPTNGFWRDAEWLYCRDRRYRATQPGPFPLAHGVAARVVKLRGIGNAIVAPVAEEFIRAYLDLEKPHNETL